MKEQFEGIKRLLDERGLRYEVSEHEPVYTSQDAARIRGEDIRTGVKALIFKTKDSFILCLVPGDRKIDMKKMKAVIKGDAHLANPQEVLECTGCEVGSVHPIGAIMDVGRTYADKRILDNEYVNFNAGLHTASIRMKSKDFMDIVKPEIVDYSR
ncbi:MAG: hypothetical protein HYW27_02440 [Candidatus Aenigmarchaeota archaeon]|nr:hypothetical protein [Candidatus Aenigmarchaeota archaeon]